MADDIRQGLRKVRDEARDFLNENDLSPDFRCFLAGFGTFFRNVPVVCRLIVREPEILLFAATQWLVIWLAYLAWTQVLYWIPDSVWQAIAAESKPSHSSYFWGVDVALVGWSFLVVAVASYPIGLLNAAMVAVHNLRCSGETSTIGRSLVIAERNLGRIWMFSVWDNWITVTAILDRLPKKNSRRKVGSELLYYAWKLATIGVLASLVVGRGYVNAGKDSLKLLTSQPERALGLRFGYSAVCWVVGVGAYVAGVVFSPWRGGDLHTTHGIFMFYQWAAWPIMIAAGVVCVVIRPFFLLGVAQLYTDVFDIRADVEGHVWEITSAGQRSLSWVSLVFILLLSGLLIAVLFPGQIGLTSAIEILAH